jgi:hypothetical protein
MKKNKRSLNPWPIVIIGYFSIFIPCMVGYVVYVTVHQKMELVRGDYYDDEIRYQKQLDRIDRTEKLEAPAVIAYDAARRSITIELPSVQAPAGTTGNIRLYRPSDESLDQDIKLALGDDGVQRLDATALRTGLWKVRVYWTVGGKDFYVGKTVVIPPLSVVPGNAALDFPSGGTRRAATSSAAFSGATDNSRCGMWAVRSARSDAGGVVAARQLPPPMRAPVRAALAAPAQS